MLSTHIAELDLPALPPAARLAHIFPSLGNTTLISIGQLCDYGCLALFAATTASVTLNGVEILSGHRSFATQHLWHLTAPTSPPTVPIPVALAAAAPTPHPTVPLPVALGAVNKSITPRDLIAFAHAALFSPALTTLTKALSKNYVPYFPGLTPEALRKFPPVTAATIKGHLDQSRQNTQSTRNTNETSPPVDPSDPQDVDTLETDEDSFPASDLDGTRSHHCFLAVTEHTGKIFTDQTGRFVLPSSSGNTQLLVMYDYDSNYIHAEPMKSKSAAEILAAYKRAHAVLTAAGLRPKLQRLDNEASTILKQFMNDENVDFQLAPPGVHRRNAAERAIRTFKNHFIAGLCTTDPDFPLHLWDRLLPQALLSLNLLRGSRINPHLSAWAQVHGAYDFNRTPIAPPGTHVLVHEKPDARKTWAPHAVDAWYPSQSRSPIYYIRFS